MPPLHTPQVSPGYAEEVKTWLGGWGMDGLLASRGFVLNGVINGIDTEWVCCVACLLRRTVWPAANGLGTQCVLKLACLLRRTAWHRCQHLQH